MLGPEQILHFFVFAVDENAVLVNYLLQSAELVVPGVNLVAMIFKRYKIVLIQITYIIDLRHSKRQILFSPLLKLRQLLAEINALIRKVWNLLVFHGFE